VVRQLMVVGKLPLELRLMDRVETTIELDLKVGWEHSMAQLGD